MSSPLVADPGSVSVAELGQPNGVREIEGEHAAGESAVYVHGIIPRIADPRNRVFPAIAHRHSPRCPDRFAAAPSAGRKGRQQNSPTLSIHKYTIRPRPE